MGANATRRRRRALGAPGRVLIIVQNLPVPLDRRVWMECRALVRAGYGVSVICPKGPGDPSYQEIDGVRIRKYPPPRGATGPVGYAAEFLYCWVATTLLAIRTLLREGFDVVQACNPPDTYFALAAPLKLLGKRFVYDQHDLCPELYESRFGDRRFRGLLVALERATYLVADEVVVPNESYREIALGRGRRDPATVTVVQSGPDAGEMRRGRPDPSLRGSRPYLCCYLGVMGPQDGVDLAVEAAAALVNDHGRDDVHFAFMGFGDCYDDLVAQAHALGLDDRVTFTGRVGPSEIARYLSTADVGLSPDPKSPLNDRSTMNKVLEYMAFEVPVVAFDLLETRRSAEDAAVYVPSGDVRAFAKAVDELLGDRERRAVMGAAGRARIESALAWEHQAPQFVGVYDRLLGNPARPGAGTST